MTAEQLKRIMPYATAKSIDKYLSWLNDLMPKYGIDTPLRCAHFLAQLAHESGSLQYVRELASGKAYEGRKDLGNTYSGDGVKYKGRGLIQLTGRANYTLFNSTLPAEQNVVDHPELLEEPELAVAASCWFWKRNKLNELADRDDIKAVTRRINGGYNGLAEREKYLTNAKKVLFMKDENILLTVCLVVIFIFMGGLTLQSCKSTKMTRNTRLEVDTARHTEETKKILADSTFWESLKANIKLEWVQERYIPVQDSTGRITGSVLAERCAVTSSKEEQRDSGTAIRKEETGSVVSSVSGKTKLAEDIKTEKKPPWSIPVYVYVGLFITILAVFYFRKFRNRILK